MKILYVVSNLEKCGPMNVLFNIVKKISNKTNCFILTLSTENQKSMLDEFEKYNIKIIQLNMDRKTSKKIYKSKLKMIIEQIRPDIIHSHGYRSDKYINSLKKELTFQHITTLHNFPFSDYPRLYGFIPGILLSILHLIVINKINHKIACSYSIAKKLEMMGIKELAVIQNGVDVKEFTPLNLDEKILLRKKLNLPQNKKIIISTGALIKRKRPIRLLKAISNYQDFDNVQFIVLGDGKLWKRASKYSNENIQLLGSTNNVSEYLQVSDVFISNSKAEGLPMAMLEAIAAGLTIVGSDIPSHREVQNIIGDKVLLYKGQSMKTINDKLNQALSKGKLPNDISLEEIKKISGQVMAEKYLHYYQKIQVKK
ncbi:Glycosyltransferase involved in cell wall bisynthesis OS=Ureibacillus acetophenoni OX=614649 GN=SAMN05877842_104139 PE=4 SV=1 [Ureibacillus acetophenoni]